ncbi:hypothetical protein LJR225_004867 [Phenylobacterium sp. LjRoot225]|uniref:hypothetical protein n=1 Tax=Phenylobacterium sp. LjRoot225 TaxID=3342285 RepID=UPI003ECE3396
MTAVDTSRRKLDLGRVFGDTFGVIRRQAVPLLGVTFVLSYLPSLLNSFVTTSILKVAKPSPAAPFAAFSAFSQPLYSVAVIVVSLLSLLALACQLGIAIGDLEGRSPSLPDLLRGGLRKILPLLGAGLLLGLGVMFGFVLLFVPGVILGLMWVVAFPAIAAETSNPVKALGRSRALTRGNRWRILGLVLLLWLVIIVAELIFVGSTRGFGSLAQVAAPGFLTIAVVSLFNAFLSLVMSVGSAALYTQLREMKGGGGESLAQVFA